MAETYGIIDVKGVPAQKLALLSCGLRENSRIMQILSGAKCTTDTLLIAAAVDRLSLILWSKTEDAQHGRNKPESIVKKILNSDQTEDDDILRFDSPEEFEAARSGILGG